jgi:CRISPR/Cas system-associated exonuclease Cas4 (RecB family)
VIKNYFDTFRPTGELPPMIEGKIEGKLENPFQEIYLYEINEKYGFYGRLDECVISPQGKYIPIDFKTSSSDSRGTQILPAYQNQMDEFAFLLERNNKKTAGFGYLIYFYPDDSKNLHNGFPMIIHIQKVETHPEGVENRLREAIEILEGDIPQPSNECPFCKWYDDYSKVLNGSYKKGRNNNQIDETPLKMSDSIFSMKLNAGGKTYFLMLEKLKQAISIYRSLNLD